MSASLSRFNPQNPFEQSTIAQIEVNKRQLLEYPHDLHHVRTLVEEVRLLVTVLNLVRLDIPTDLAELGDRVTKLGHLYELIEELPNGAYTITSDGKIDLNRSKHSFSAWLKTVEGVRLVYHLIRADLCDGKSEKLSNFCFLGLNLSRRYEWGEGERLSFLERAVKEQDESLALCLLGKGANPRCEHVVEGNLFTLRLATQFCSLSVIQSIQPTADEINQDGGDCPSLLHLACSNPDADAIILDFLGRGGLPFVCDKNLHFPIVYYKGDNAAVFRRLIPPKDMCFLVDVNGETTCDLILKTQDPMRIRVFLETLGDEKVVSRIVTKGTNESLKLVIPYVPLGLIFRILLKNLDLDKVNIFFNSLKDPALSKIYYGSEDEFLEAILRSGNGELLQVYAESRGWH